MKRFFRRMFPELTAVPESGNRPVLRFNSELGDFRIDIHAADNGRMVELTYFLSNEYDGSKTLRRIVDDDGNLVDAIATLLTQVALDKAGQKA